MKSVKLLLRFAVLGGLILLLVIPLLLIRGVISDRAGYRDEAIERVARSKAGEQRFVGPLRYVPWTREVEMKVRDEDGQTRVERHQETGVVMQAPARLWVDGVLVPGERRVGVFKVPVYTWQAKVKAEFAPMAYSAVDGRVYGRPYLAVGLSDPRGLVGVPALQVDGLPLPVRAGAGALRQGVNAELPAPPSPDAGQLPALGRVALDMQLDGTRSLAIVPIGDSTEVSLSSAWPHPLFGGSFLPNRRDIGREGFNARWSLSALATNAQAQLREGQAADALQVDLVDPVDVYTLADRASKYGLLFVLLTFTGFVLLELIRKLKIHPVQYLLVGLALAIFFLLLFSLSEHIAFWQSYLISAAACIGLQFFYLAGVMRSRALAAGFAALLTALYGVLYSLLVSEDNALLMGSLLLFGILGVVMWLTRRLDWYALGERDDLPA
ncbi:MAG TPA: cell envelope integrity protein CreD [Stenotrophomonas sp.]|nr:cell envelope integrity protein CreD [Stenotrophomonas sp.]